MQLPASNMCTICKKEVPAPTKAIQCPPESG